MQRLQGRRDVLDLSVTSLAAAFCAENLQCHITGRYSSQGGNWWRRGRVLWPPLMWVTAESPAVDAAESSKHGRRQRHDRPWWLVDRLSIVTPRLRTVDSGDGLAHILPLFTTYRTNADADVGYGWTEIDAYWDKLQRRAIKTERYH